jgi:outer membrane protein assembly factor BamB
MPRRIFLLPMILAAIATVAVAADWPQFRGPGGAGSSTEKGLPTTWSDKENVVWRTKLPGPGTSSPIVVGKRVYLTCYTGYGIEPGEGDMKDLTRHVLCIDRAKGDILWTKDFKPSLPESKYNAGNDGQHGYASSTLASDGKRLYAFFGKSGVYCLDLDGKEIWHSSVGTHTTGWGSSNSPILYKDLVIVNASVECQSLIAIDKNTGIAEWRVKKIQSSWCTPVLVDAPGGGAEIVLSDNHAVMGFDPADGKELWRVSGFDGYVCASAVSHKGIVYVVRTGGKGGSAMAIKAGGRGDVTETHVLWRNNGSSLVASPVHYQNKLYWATNGRAFCLDAATGKEVYNGRLTDNPSFYASALAGDGKLYFVSRFTGAHVVDAGAPFNELAHNTFADDKSRTNACPIAHNGCVLLRTDLYLYCLAKK